ncbi:MAG: YtxH domain-containing protein [Chlamydiales bacterium]|nr:YtxH domain-containing protein [Chlamydiales bacterium]
MLGKKKKGRSDSGLAPSFALGALIGGLLGGAAALLLAPKSGEEMREDLVDHYQKVSNETAELVDAVCDHSLEMIDRAKKIAEEAKEAAAKYRER